jgi:hypothetical protein
MFKKIEQREVKKIEPSYFQQMLNSVFPNQNDDDEEEEEEETDEQKKKETPDFVNQANAEELAGNENDNGEISIKRSKTTGNIQFENENGINEDENLNHSNHRNDNENTTNINDKPAIEIDDSNAGGKKRRNKK